MSGTRDDDPDAPVSENKMRTRICTHIIRYTHVCSLSLSLSLSLCMCVCVRVITCVCVVARVSVSLAACVHMYVCVTACVFVCMRVFPCMHAYLCGPCFPLRCSTFCVEVCVFTGRPQRHPFASSDLNQKVVHDIIVRPQFRVSVRMQESARAHITARSQFRVPAKAGPVHSAAHTAWM